MPRKRSGVLHFVIYLAVRCAVSVVQIIPYSSARTLANWLAWLAFKLDRRHRLIALDNLRKSFPNRFGKAELNKLALATYQHLLMLVIEISQLPRKMHRHNAHEFFHLSAETIALLRSKRPVLIVTGHFGNWELGGCALGARGFGTYAIARPLDNPYLEAYVRRFREHTGQTILSKKDLPGIQAALANGRKIAVLADQSAGPRGLMVDFFGRSASAHKGVAVLALQHQAPMLVIGCRKVAEPLRYEMAVEDIIYPEEYKGFRAQAVRQITERYTAALERIIRSAPEQYFWLHNRWKHSQPRTATPRAA
jgi:KDO2-lipid IV(A) lauroyltransferase